MIDLLRTIFRPSFLVPSVTDHCNTAKEILDLRVAFRQQLLTLVQL